MAHMLTATLYTPEEVSCAIAQRARSLRLAADLTQRALAERAAVSLSSLKRFEQTGQVAFASLVRIAFALGAQTDLDALFAPPDPRTLDDVMDSGSTRQRGRGS